MPKREADCDHGWRRPDPVQHSIRFAVGSPDALFSGIWRLVADKDDAYLGGQQRLLPAWDRRPSRPVMPVSDVRERHAVLVRAGLPGL